MKRLASLAAGLCLAGGLASAATFTGKLMDADCYNTNKVDSHENGHKTYHSITKTCAPTASTSNFAVRITGNPYNEYLGDTVRLDDPGNTEAASEMQNGTLRTSKDGTVHVKVSGKILGEALQTGAIGSTRHGAAEVPVGK